MTPNLAVHCAVCLEHIQLLFMHCYRHVIQSTQTPHELFQYYLVLAFLLQFPTCWHHKVDVHIAHLRELHRDPLWLTSNGWSSFQRNEARKQRHCKMKKRIRVSVSIFLFGLRVPCSFWSQGCVFHCTVDSFIKLPLTFLSIASIFI